MARVTRDIERKFTDKNNELSDLLTLAKQLQQQRKDKNKMYSVHESEIFCIAKGKQGDQINVLLAAAAGYNFAKLLAWFYWAIKKCQIFIEKNLTFEKTNTTMIV